MSIYANSFLSVFAKHLTDLHEQAAPLKPRGGVDIGYRENTLRAAIREMFRKSPSRFPAGFGIERKLPNDPNRGNVDYFVTDERPLTEGSIAATCELKGPVRMAFLDPRCFGRNWSRVFTNDIRKQRDRALAFPNAEHYVALLVPTGMDSIRRSAYAEILNRTLDAVPGANVNETAVAELQLAVPLTIFMLGVSAAKRETAAPVSKAIETRTAVVMTA